MFGKRWRFTVTMIYFFQQWLEIFECWCAAGTYTQNRPAGKADQICLTYQGQTCLGRSERKVCISSFPLKIILLESLYVGSKIRVWQLKPVTFFSRVSSTNWGWKLGSVPWKWDRCNNTKFQIDVFFSDSFFSALTSEQTGKKKKRMSGPEVDRKEYFVFTTVRELGTLCSDSIIGEGKPEKRNCRKMQPSVLFPFLFSSSPVSETLGSLFQAWVSALLITGLSRTALQQKLWLQTTWAKVAEYQ